MELDDTSGWDVNLTVYIYNPDATLAIELYVHVWVGSGHVDPSVGTFLLNVDTRFARLTQPAFDGLQLASGAYAVLNHGAATAGSPGRSGSSPR